MYGMHEMYKIYRFLPNCLQKDQFHVRKYCDHYSENHVCTIKEFDDLDLSYTGRVSLIPDGFHREPESESDPDSEFSQSTDDEEEEDYDTDIYEEDEDYDDENFGEYQDIDDENFEEGVDEELGPESESDVEEALAPN